MFGKKHHLWGPSYVQFPVLGSGDWRYLRNKGYLLAENVSTTFMYLPEQFPKAKKNQGLYVLERRGLLWFCQSGLQLVLRIGHNESMDVYGCVGKSHCSSVGRVFCYTG